MASPIVNDNNINIEVEVDSSLQDKVHKSLLTLYNKNNVFGFFLLKFLNHDNSLFDNDIDILKKLLVFDSKYSQANFALQFKNSVNDIKKDIRKNISAYKKELKKANKPVKEKAPRKTKTSDSENKPKKEKKNNKKDSSNEDQLINELVSLADSNHPALSDKKTHAINAVNKLVENISPIVYDKQNTTPLKEIVEQTNMKKNKKVKKNNSQDSSTHAENNDLSEKNTKKPRQKKSDKSDKPDKPDKPGKNKKSDKKSLAEGTNFTLVDSTPSDINDEEELQVSVFEFENKQYLIDDQHVIYDFVSHDEIGKFIDGKIIYN